MSARTGRTTWVLPRREVPAGAITAGPRMARNTTAGPPTVGNTAVGPRTGAEQRPEATTIPPATAAELPAAWHTTAMSASGRVGSPPGTLTGLFCRGPVNALASLTSGNY